MSTSRVAPGAVALGQLGGDYGLTWPERLTAELGAKLSGATWEPEVRKLRGEYSIQTQLPGGMQDIPNAAVATAPNYQALLTSLDNLGNPPGAAPTHYSLAAVQAHESKHASRCHQALEDVSEAIENLIKPVTVPSTGPVDTAGAAVGRIQALGGYGGAINTGFGRWDNRFDALINGDHTGDGPCELAEKGVSVPLRNAIYDLARTNRWLPGNAQVGMPVGTLGVAAAQANVVAPPPVVARPAVTLPGGSARASQVRVWPPPPGG